ncbi:MAG: enolase C-terminal domain-like protein [Pseudomonadota bacterium]
MIQAIDFTHISDFLDREEAYDKLISARSNQDGRERRLLAEGYPAYTTSAGWLGYSDKQFCDLLLEAYAAGWRHFKIKVGRDLREDQRRCALFRQTLGDDVLLSIDANQIWDVSTAVHHIDALSTYDLFWVEEPTNPDDVLAHQTIARAVPNVRIATGEHAANKVMFKQLLQASAIRICQIDACRLAGVNEVLAVLLMADKAGVPVCPHAGGIGLCEYVQHLSMIDYLCVSGSWEGRFIEHAGQLHGHFEDPISVRDGRYMAPRAPGFSVDLKPQSLAEHTFPGGTVWAQLLDGVGA